MRRAGALCPSLEKYGKVTTLIFRKRQKRGGAPPHVQNRRVEEGARPKFYHIEFDMLVKGNTVRRRGGAVRQFGVTVDGSTRLVTSGDTVDRRTYEALRAANALRDPDTDRAGQNEGECPPPRETDAPAEE